MVGLPKIICVVVCVCVCVFMSSGVCLYWCERLFGGGCCRGFLWFSCMVCLLTVLCIECAGESMIVWC